MNTWPRELKIALRRQLWTVQRWVMRPDNDVAKGHLRPDASAALQVLSLGKPSELFESVE